jgi:diadenosine tetraphosphatase ApaH/serine/threonine PP2A family protein phosphatase
VRLLLLSDVHSNLEALEACLDAAPEYDRAASLGDVVGYGASPNQTAELLRAMEAIHVRGNHDRVCGSLIGIEFFNPLAAAAARWTRSELSEPNLAWLRSLPQGPVRDPEWSETQFVHGSPLDEDTYLSSASTAGEALERALSPLTFFGHTHVQCAYAQPAAASAAGASPSKIRPAPPAALLSAESMPDAGGAQRRLLRLEGSRRYMVNPGSVGQPRDRDPRAAFALYDSDARTIVFYRVAYNIAGAQTRILEAGLPKPLAWRLEVGR